MSPGRRPLPDGPVRRSLVVLALLVAGCTSALPSPSPSQTPAPTVTSSPTASPTPTPGPSPTPVPIDQELLAGRFTVLVAGTDTSLSRRAAGVDRYNTDALMVVSISPDKSRIDIISLPRDTVDVPMADGSIYRGKINGIAMRLGIAALRDGVATLLGVPIDRYVEVDMDDFVWMVDAVGGIDLTLPAAIADPKVHLQLPAGPNHLDGAHALAFSRTRFDSDYGRAARQQEVILALVAKWLHPDLGALLIAALNLSSLETDIPVGELPTLLEIGRRAAAAKVVAIVLRPPRYSLFVGIEPKSSRGWVMIPNVAAMRRYARAALADQPGG